MAYFEKPPTDSPDINAPAGEFVYNYHFQEGNRHSEKMPEALPIMSQFPHVQNALPYKIRHGKQGEEGKMVIFDHYVGFHVHFPKWKGFLSSYYPFFPAGRVLNLCLFIAVS